MHVITPDWNDTIASLLKLVRSRIDHEDDFYFVWKERNSRRHSGVWVTTEKLTRNIDKQIRNQISSLRYTKDHPSEEMMRRWFESNRDISTYL
ncbi:LOW QUALITY PROTEIN: hypothetical protein HID58_081959 [Brassica napus]|uniref:Uncharacterized protein n=1 Tax=Brassica napus TaxID=3708 RepID=A0ABQ7YBT7_BRANA|nr:LOW QUALITY PROTEIN: hypothetical protein HID58_081959 [Brassica napus]